MLRLKQRGENVKQTTILLVDDEISIVKMVEMVLKKEGFEKILTAYTGREAISLLQTHKVDFIILDVMLPDANGFQLCQEIRQLSAAYILFLTARVSDLDVLTGFENGGDDYVTKPFNPLEIVARIKARMRRNIMTVPENRVLDTQRYDYGHFIVNERAGELIIDGKPVPCPAQVFLLLLYFCKNPNKVISKEKLFEAVWGYESMVDDNTVMVHIRRIREKIEPKPSEPRYLITVRGLGYKLVKDREE